MCQRANGFCHPRCLYQLGQDHTEKREKEWRWGKGNISQSEAKWLAGNSTVRPDLLASLQIIHTVSPEFPVPKGKIEQPSYLRTFPD